MFCPNPQCPDFVDEGIHGEYVDTMSVCPKCGAALVPEPPQDVGFPAEPIGEDVDLDGEAEPISAPAPTGVLVSLAAFDRPEEVEALISRLAEHGVTAFAFLDDGRDFVDQQGVEPCTRLLVPSSQAEAAARLIERDLVAGRE